MKNKKKKGFTLMEMLIVVAIIVILIAVAIPTFTSELKKAEQAVELANARATYATAVIKVMTESPAPSSFNSGYPFITDYIKAGKKQYMAYVAPGNFNDISEVIDAMYVYVYCSEGSIANEDNAYPNHPERGTFYKSDFIG